MNAPQFELKLWWLQRALHAMMNPIMTAKHSSAGKALDLVFQCNSMIDGHLLLYVESHVQTGSAPYLKEVSVCIEDRGQGTAANRYLGLHCQAFTAHLNCGQLNANPKNRSYFRHCVAAHTTAHSHSWSSALTHLQCWNNWQKADRIRCRGEIGKSCCTADVD